MTQPIQPNPNNFWTYQLDGQEKCDLAYHDQASARAAAQRDYDQYCAEQFQPGTYDTTVELFRCAETDDEPSILQTVRETLVSEVERPDIEEHGTWNKAGTGVA